MNFAKGAIMGMIAGTVVGVMNSSSIMGMYKKGKKQIIIYYFFTKLTLNDVTKL